MSKYSFTAKFIAHEGKRDELISILAQAAEGMTDVTACHLYLIHKDNKDENAIRIYELWDSKEAHDASLKAPGAAELIGKAMPMLNGMPEVMEWEAVAGKGY